MKSSRRQVEVDVMADAQLPLFDDPLDELQAARQAVIAERIAELDNTDQHEHDHEHERKAE